MGIRVVWESGHIPAEWKNACTVLVDKKGSGDKPVNVRPITLESVPLKVFTSCLHDSIFSFLRQNDFIEAEIQKGFTPKIAGVPEHTSMMANIIDKARIKQRSLAITLLDLKNAFGEVHHNLIQEVLAYHHIPAKTKALISSLYTGFHTSVITGDFLTPAIPIRQGVLQGDCLNPLLFNMCFNTFIQFIHQEKYKQLGFSSHDTFDCLSKPVHWCQFADDAVVVTTNERENQLLLNCFTKWCKWSDMVIRVDKCFDNTVKPGVYFRYVDDTFVIFSSELDCDCFHEKLNLLHPALNFTVEKEQNNSLSFLDVLVEKEGTGFLTSVYKKPTFTGQYIRWNSFSPKSRNISLIKTLVHRALMICSKTKLGSELDRVKQLLIENGYPDDVLISCIKQKLANFAAEKPCGPEKCPVYLKLPWIGNVSSRFENQINKAITSWLYAVKPRVVYNTKVMLPSAKKERSYHSKKLCSL